MSLFRQNDNTEREHKGGNRPDGFLIGLLLGILLYFLFVSSQDPNFFRGFFSVNYTHILAVAQNHNFIA